MTIDWNNIKKHLVKMYTTRLNYSNEDKESILKLVDFFHSILEHSQENIKPYSQTIIEQLDNFFIKENLTDRNIPHALAVQLQPFLDSLYKLLSYSNVPSSLSGIWKFFLRNKNILSDSNVNKFTQRDVITPPSYFKNKVDGGVTSIGEYLKIAYDLRNVTSHDEYEDLTKFNSSKYVEEILCCYLYIIQQYVSELSSVISQIDTTISALSSYRNQLQKTLTNDNSKLFFQSEFNVDTDVINETKITVRAKFNKDVSQAKSYLPNTDSSLSSKSRKFIRNSELLHSKEEKEYFPNEDTIMRETKHLLLEGIATSGKTTLLKKTGLKFLTSSNENLVLYVELGKVTSEKIANEILHERIKELKTISRQTLNLENYSILVLLDGFDEIPSNNIKDIILDIVENLSAKYHKIKVVITSRPHDYISDNEFLSQKFKKYKLLPLTIKEMEGLAGGVLGETNKEYSSFIRFIKKPEILKAFPRTPLTTILLAILFKEDKLDTRDLPRNITELYNKIIDILLDKWDTSKGISSQYKIQQKEFILANIAFYMQENRLNSISQEDLSSFLDSFISDRLPDLQDQMKDVKSFMKTICDRTTLLIFNKEDKTYKFFHLTIQEYLSSKAIRSSNEQVLIDNFLDEWWLNANIFYAGKQPDDASVLGKVSTLRTIYPYNTEDKINYVIHASNVLRAAHLETSTLRKQVIHSIIKIFDEFVRSLIKDIVDEKIPMLHRKGKSRRENTLLSVILFCRQRFVELLKFSSFSRELKEEWIEIINNNVEYTDITYYCLAYCISSLENKSEYLEEFAFLDKNVRWYRIVQVDVDESTWKSDSYKLRLKLKRKANRNAQYIHQQFTERLSRHYQSVIGNNE